ncbi:unnamed protein product [Spirodela intermedia]|uniref:CNNM transmembrane domain-containing protein n=1 Tax=Spirodela intermedia TaxID=51605 RepID=A0A7I8IIH6_SPIIN|nr:unnamed protein product [Spirodela intermedia]CAA6657673.1 unnamed protein product [Spirodela intermedia]
MAVEYHCCQPQFFFHIAIIVLLVVFAGMMSGLTLGLMSMSLVDLEVLAKSGTPNDRKHAAKILPVVQKQHLLLCTLLICNAAAMEALPIFLDTLVTAWGAILISVTLLLLFGEIIPQAVCSRYGLAIGAAVAPLVRVLVWICSPVAYPISKLLDCLLGNGHIALFRRAELKTLVTLHGNEAGKGGELTHDETTIIAGALELSDKKASDAMTSISETFSIDINAKFNRELMQMILDKGHSRVPVYYGKPTNIVGLILVKNLLYIHPTDEVPVMNVTIRKIPRVTEDRPLYDILNEFQKGHSHMAVVVKQIHPTEQPGMHADGGKNEEKNVKLEIDGHRPNELSVKSYRPINKRKSLPGGSQSSNRVLPEMKEAVGIITMEDVIEELLQEEIYDETDYQDTDFACQ